MEAFAGGLITNYPFPHPRPHISFAIHVLVFFWVLLFLLIWHAPKYYKWSLHQVWESIYHLGLKPQIFINHLESLEFVMRNLKPIFVSVWDTFPSTWITIIRRNYVFRHSLFPRYSRILRLSRKRLGVTRLVRIHICTSPPRKHIIIFINHVINIMKSWCLRAKYVCVIVCVCANSHCITLNVRHYLCNVQVNDVYMWHAIEFIWLIDCYFTKNRQTNG